MGLWCDAPLVLAAGAGISGPDLRVAEIFASFLDSEEDLAGFVSQF